MKVLVVVFTLMAASLAAEYPAPGVQRGLLVLPKPGPAAYTAQSQQQQAYSGNQEQQSPELLSPQFADRRGVYFVEVTQERLQGLVAKTQQVPSQVSEDSQTLNYAQYNQQTRTPVNSRYLPLQEPEVSSFGSSSQYRVAEPTFEATIKYVPVLLEK